MDNLNQNNRLSLELDRARGQLKELIRRAILRRRMPFFQKLIKEDKAWALYVSVIQKYIKKYRDKKLSTNYAKASPEQKKVLEHMDIELACMENLIEIPARAIKQTLIAEHDKAEADLIREVKTEVGE